MLFTFRLFIGWRGDSCSQTNVGKELLRNFSFWALGPRTITAGSPAQRTQSFRFPSSLINHSTLLLERSSAKRAKLLVFTIMHSITRQALSTRTLDRLNHGRLEHSSAKLLVFYASTRSSCLYWTRRSAKLLVFTIMHSNTRQALRVDAFGLREMVLGKSRQAHQRTIMHSNTRTRNGTG